MSNPTGQKRVSDRSRKNADWWITPAATTQALMDRELFPRRVWDCCCGTGEMSEVIQAAGYEVLATDLHDRGYGRGGIDFLMELPRDDLPEAIICNPPFNLAHEFMVQAVQRLRMRKVALLVQLSFLAGEKRGRFYRQFAPARSWVFSARQIMWAGEIPEWQRDPKARGQIDFQWLVWERAHAPGPVTRFIDG